MLTRRNFLALTLAAPFLLRAKATKEAADQVVNLRFTNETPEPKVIHIRFTHSETVHHSNWHHFKSLSKDLRRKLDAPLVFEELNA